MTQKGQSGKAVGAAVLCSAIGGIASALVMMAATEPLANWAIRNIGPPEIFALVFFGLIVASSVGARTIWKGWMSVLIGLLVATIGQDPVGGINRYNFGMTDLAAGIAFIPAILGFFAVSEIFVQAEKKASGKYQAPKVSMAFPSFIELWMHKIAVLRSILVGFFCGILPGIGATLAAFMSYGEAVRWSKNPEEFGKGKLEGVISAETANNAACTGSFVPLLTLGIPGSGTTAILLGALIALNVTPGPRLMVDEPQIFWAVIMSMFIGNLVLLILNLPLIPYIAKLLAIPRKFLIPFILFFTLMGAYIGQNNATELLMLVGFGIFGIALKFANYPLPPLLIGFILGGMMEDNFSRSMQLYGGVSFILERPMTFGLLVIAACLIIVPVLRTRLAK